MRGAEAVVTLGETYGRERTVSKTRVAKSYRDPRLDGSLREARTRTEARLLADARAAGVRTPCVLDADLAQARLVLEELPGETLRAVLPRVDAGTRARLLADVGAIVQRLHAGGIVHGDLTTSNLLRGPDGEVALLDFGLAGRSVEAEDRGTDLHVLDEALRATHPEVEGGFDAALGAYFAAGGAPEVRDVLARIAKRGRYRGGP